MQTAKFVYWEEDGAWLGYLQDYPDYWTQGGTLEGLEVDHALVEALAPCGPAGSGEDRDVVPARREQLRELEGAAGRPAPGRRGDEQDPHERVIVPDRYPPSFPRDIV